MNDNIINGNSKTCLECGELLGAGREDKKFCNDLCRTAYNNRRRKENIPTEPADNDRQKAAFEKIFHILVNNRDLLQMHDLYVEQPYMLRDMLGKGFNPKYFTSEHTIEGLGVFKFCFDYGYQITEEGRVYILERPEEIY